MYLAPQNILVQLYQHLAIKLYYIVYCSVFMIQTSIFSFHKMLVVGFFYILSTALGQLRKCSFQARLTLKKWKSGNNSASYLAVTYF